MACKHCDDWPTVPIFYSRDKLSLKRDIHPGIQVEIDPYDATMWIGACPDTYEPGWLEAEIPINFCPMCGEKLREETSE